MSVNASLRPVLLQCLDTRVSFVIGSTFNIARAFLLLPLSLIVLYLGHQRWRQQRSFTNTSHSDIFTYNVALVELIWCFGCALLLWGSSTGVKTVGFWVIFISFSGEGLFHVLTCVERYLAVVHPVTYMGLRQVQGVRIRNVSIGFVWFLSFGMGSGTSLLNPTLASLPLFCLTFLSLVVVSFCSLSVLCALIGPGPGEGAGHRERVDQSKQRAFNTIVAITGVLWLWFVGILVTVTLDASRLLDPGADCVVKVSALWFNLPSSLVIPLLYLHRAGKLPGCKHKADSTE